MPGDSFNGSFTSSGSGGFDVTSCGRALNNERSGYVEKSKRHTPQRTGELASSWPLWALRKPLDFALESGANFDLVTFQILGQKADQSQRVGFRMHHIRGKAGALASPVGEDVSCVDRRA